MNDIDTMKAEIEKLREELGYKERALSYIAYEVKHKYDNEYSVIQDAIETARDAYEYEFDGIMYRIWMQKAADLPAGWYCGVGARINDAFHRTSDKYKADMFQDDATALLIVKDLREYGYGCKLVPDLSTDRMLEILMPTVDEEEVE